MGCWLAAWHRWKRHTDHETVWTALRHAADCRHPEDSEAAVLLALRGWATFIQQPGQEHWLCACAEVEAEAARRQHEANVHP
jgi:hypothetical protein